MTDSQDRSRSIDVPARLLAELGEIVAAARDRSAIELVCARLRQSLDCVAFVYQRDASDRLWLSAGGESRGVLPAPPSVDLLDQALGSSDAATARLVPLATLLDTAGGNAETAIIAPIFSTNSPIGALILIRSEWPGEIAEIAALLARVLGAFLGRIAKESASAPTSTETAETSFERVFDLSPMILCITDLETGRFVEINDYFTQATGYTRDDAIGKTPVDLDLWVAPEVRQEGLTDIRSGKVLRSREMQFRTKSGGILNMLLAGAMIEFRGRPSALSALTDVTDRKRVETLLARYRLLAENSRDIVLFFRQDGTIAEANKAASDIYGFSSAELLSMTVADLRDPGTLSGLTEEFRAALDQGIRFETRHRRRDGIIFPVEVVSQSAEIAGENLVISVVRDVTARVDAENALRESEERLRFALEAARMSTWEIDFASGERSAGGYHEQLLGAAPPTLEGILDMVHPEDRERVRQACLSALDHGVAYSEEFRFLHSSGELRWISAHGHRIDRDGSPTRLLVGVSYDVTDRKSADAQRLASERQLQALVDTLPQLVWVAVPEGECVYLSSQWEEFTGVPALEMLGYGWLEYVHPADREAINRDWNAVRASGDPLDTEFRIRRRDGAYRWFKVRASAVHDQSGEILRWYGSNTDIHELKLLEERRRDLIDTLAHDLQNPLTAILAQSQILQRRLVRGHAIESASLDMLADVAESMAAAIAEMSDASMLASGQELELNRLTVDLSELMERCVTLYEGTSAHHPIRVVYPESPLEGDWDRARLERVFGNIFSNAIKYSPAGGEIQVRLQRWVEPTGEWARVDIEDQGIGIPEGDLEHIFDPRRRGANVGRIQGSGLGLSGAAEVVRLHGGRIDVNSSEGSGSVFTVWLPLARIESAPSSAASDHLPAR